jgi:hypothetical protein
VNSGISIQFNENDADLKREGTVVMKAIRNGGLYYVDGNQICSDDQVDQHAQIVQEKVKEYEIMHYRLGHLSHSSIQKLIDKQAIENAPYMSTGAQVSQHVCEGCQVGKTHREAFKTATSRVPASEILGRLHCDLMGPIRVDENGIEKVADAIGYYAYPSVVTDEKSRRVFVKLQKSKSETAEHIINFITTQERQTGKLVKEFHSDSGTEYTNKTLTDFFKSKVLNIQLHVHILHKIMVLPKETIEQ